jgi:hypothetical protein
VEVQRLEHHLVSAVLMTNHYLKEDLSGALLLQAKASSYYLLAGSTNYLTAIRVNSVTFGTIVVAVTDNA